MVQPARSGSALDLCHKRLEVTYVRPNPSAHIAQRCWAGRQEASSTLTEGPAMVMATPPSRPKDETPLPLDRPYGAANETVVLYDDAMGVEDLGTRHGVIEMSCAPEPKLRWEIEIRPGDSIHPDRNPRELLLQHEGRDWPVTSYHGTSHAGWINEAQLGRPDAMLRRVRANWMNLPAIFGPVGLCGLGPDGRLSYWAGRWRLEAGGWSITLDERQDYAQATADARHQRLFVLTHTMEIRRTDGEDFSADQATALLEHLRIAFSFAFGYWNSSILPRGYDKDDRVVWEHWYAPICDPHPRIPTAWLYRGRPEDLTELARCALDVFADPQRGPATRLQMQLTVAATDRGFVEQRILTAGPALENLAWTRLVQRPASSQRTHRGWTDREYKDRRAEERLRYLLEEARVPTDIDPDRFPGVAAFVAADGADGAAAVTSVRNHLVHPTAPDELARHSGLVHEASLLQRRYLVMLVLHDIGYRGHIVDPADQTAWDGDTRPVPWLAGTAQPPMPPDRRQIQAARHRERTIGSQQRRPRG